MPPADHFTDNLKKSMLESMVMGVKGLDSVKNIQNYNKARRKEPLTYQAYLTLLLSTATTLNASRGFHHQNLRKSNINSLSTEYSTNMSYSNNEQSHNIDSYLIHELNLQHENSKIQKASSTPRPFTNGPKMAKEKWMSLTTQEKQSWDTFSNQSKGIILGITQPNSIPKFSSSLHDISAAEYFTLAHNYENHRAYNSEMHTNNDNNHEDSDEKSY